MRRPSFVSPWRQARHVLGINARNLLYVHGLNPRRHFPLADDKSLTKKILEAAGVPTPRTLMELTNLAEVGRARERLEQIGEFVVKPARGRQGNGIIVVAGSEAGRFRKADGSAAAWNDLRRALGDILFGVHSFGQSDHVLVERRIRAHPGLGALGELGLPDVRIILLHGHPAMAMMRVPTRASGGRANLHQGAVGVALRVTDGMAFRAVLKGKVVTRHPDNRAPLVGFSPPCWEKVIGAARSAGAVLPLPYLGVDVVLDALAGPVVMEVNARPGLEIQNVNGAGLRRRLERLGRRAGGCR